MEKCRLYDTSTGKSYGKRVVYHGVVNEFGDIDLYYLDRRREKVLLAVLGLAVYPVDKEKIIPAK